MSDGTTISLVIENYNPISPPQKSPSENYCLRNSTVVNDFLRLSLLSQYQKLQSTSEPKSPIISDLEIFADLHTFLIMHRNKLRSQYSGRGRSDRNNLWGSKVPNIEKGYARNRTKN